MTGLATTSEGIRRAVLALIGMAAIGTSAPVNKVHAHDDASFGHGHNAHEHSHSPFRTPVHEGDDEPETTDAGTLHAHADGCVAVGLTSTVDREISIPADSRSYIPRPAARPPDKPICPLYRPPIA